MANRFPLVLDTTDGNKVKELPSGDNLNLRSNNIVDVKDIVALGTIDAKNVTVNGKKVTPQSLLTLDSELPNNTDRVVKVNSTGTGFDFADQLGGALSSFTNDIGFITENELETYLAQNYINGIFADIKFSNSSHDVTITTDTLTENRNLRFPNENGILATRNWVSQTFGSSEKLYNSLFKCSASIAVGSLTNNKANILSTVESINNFNPNDSIRIYGANSVPGLLIPACNVTFELSKNGFATSTTPVTYYYKVAEFNVENGNISPAGDEKSVVVDDAVAFNLDNNIELSNILGLSTDVGVLVYRKKGANGTYELIAVLGPGNLTDARYIDYSSFDQNSWSGLSPSNTYNTPALIHFPVSPPTTPEYGWSTVKITNVDITNNKITISPAVYTKVGTVNIAMDDTETLQSLIQQQVDFGKSSLRLSDATYVVSKLEIPDNFSIIGVPGMTVLYKLPWSSSSSAGNTNAIFKSATLNGPTNITISSVIIDGNLLNQFLIDDTATDSLNYLLNFGTLGSDINILNVIARNTIGGGIYATRCKNLKISSSEFKNSGVSDRYEYSPGVLYQTSNSMITESKFENFSTALDVSTSNQVVVSSNIIKNCGTGLLVYGSKFLVSSPNVLLGPANELLPSPDILNSVYNSINIAPEINQSFVSDQYRYQENGVNFNLAANTSNNIMYEVWKLEKTADGVETLYEQINAAALTTDVLLRDIPAGNDKTQGQFQFRIIADHVALLKSTYSYTTLKTARSTHVGIVYIVALEEFVTAATVASVGSIIGNEYTINITNAKYLSVGASVQLQNHIGFDTGISSLRGTVVRISVDSNNDGTVTIRYPGATLTAGNDVNRLGTLNIINKFTLAKGRIL